MIPKQGRDKPSKLGALCFGYEIKTATYALTMCSIKEDHMKPIITSFIILLTSCLAIQSSFAQEGDENQKSTSQENDESAVKAAVDFFLIALGNGELEKVKTMFLPNANIASVSISNGESKIFTVSAEQYISQREEKQTRKFQEPVRNYTVNISQGMLAFVRADATVYYDGKASHHTNDFFILIKDNDVWKILSGSYTVEPLMKEN